MMIPRCLILQSTLLVLLLLLGTTTLCNADTRIANGDKRSPFLEFALQKQITTATTNCQKYLFGDYNRDGILDMYCIIQQQQNHGVAVIVFDGADEYDSILLEESRSSSDALHMTTTSTGVMDYTIGDYNGDGMLDIWVVETSTSTAATAPIQLSILDGSDNFESAQTAISTPLDTTFKWSFHAVDWNQDGTLDLMGVTTAGVVHILDGTSLFQTFILQTSRTMFTTTNDDDDNNHWSFAVGDYNHDGTMDLYGIRSGGSEKAQVHVLNGAHQFETFLVQTKTALYAASGDGWQFAVGDYDGDGENDILCMDSGGSSSFVLHVLRYKTINSYWSDPLLWLHPIPTEHDDVIIPHNKKIIFNEEDVTVKSIRIDGQLIVMAQHDNNHAVALNCEWMLLNNGLFQVGTERRPFLQKFVLTLLGDAPQTIRLPPGVLDKDVLVDNSFVMVRGRHARLSLYGELNRTSWTQLGATLEAGSRDMILKEGAVTNWVAGDRIVVASTDFDMNQAEEFSITAITHNINNQTEITLDKPAQYRHFGKVQEYENEHGRRWILDERAEVGLLTRNIVIQGSPNSELTKYGGHVTVLDHGFAQISGVEFRRMGQEGRVGKYPISWSMLGDTKHQYIQNSSIHHTYNRAVVVHGSSGICVVHNVAYDHVGHGYVLEDGSELRNVVSNNLGLVTRKASSKDKAIIPTEYTHVSTFWITNPDNAFRGNSAAGSDFGGFWFALPERPTGESSAVSGYADNIRPIHTVLREFTDNTGHSNAMNLAFDGSPDPKTRELKSGRYQPRDAAGNKFVPLVANFTSYKSTDRGIWIHANTFEFSDIKSADNSRATFFAYSQVMRDSLIVGRSENDDSGDTTMPRRGHCIYNGPSGLDGVHFAGFAGDQNFALQTNGAAARKSTVHWVRNLTFDSEVLEANKVDFTSTSYLDYMWSTGVHDLDGSLSGTKGSIVIPMILPDPAHPNRTYDSLFNVPSKGSFTSVAEWGAWVGRRDQHLGHLSIYPAWQDGTAEVVPITRCGGGVPCQTVSDQGTYRHHYQNPVIVSRGYTYQVSFPRLPRSFDIHLGDVNNNDHVLVKIANVPSSTRVQSAHRAESMNALNTASATSYLIQDGHLWIRLVATEQVTDPKSNQNQPFGMFYSARAAAKVITFDKNDSSNNDGGVMDRTSTLKDFNTGLDPNGGLTAMNGASTQGINTGWSDTMNWWDVMSAADGENGFVDFHYRLEHPQDWRYLSTLVITTKLDGEGNNKDFSYRVYCYDVQQEHTTLGMCETGECSLSLTEVEDARLDAISEVLIRVHISFFADLNQEGAFQRVHLYSMSLQ